jgi:hypothetical protein
MNEIDETVRALRDCKYWSGSDNPASRDIHPLICDEAATLLESQQKEIERLREAQRWIPVSERQPKMEDAINGMIEVWEEPYGPDTMSMDYYWEYVAEVTHWRKLPDPPQKG